MKKLCFLFLLLPLYSAAQTIVSFAGGGTLPATGVLATACKLEGPNGGVFDRYGNYYFTEVLGMKVRKISPAGIITTVAGSNNTGSSGDGGPATDAKLNRPTAVAVDAAGNLFIADGANFKIRKVDDVTGIITTIAGNGSIGFSGDNVPATNAQVSTVEDVCVDKAGNIYFSDRDNNRVRRISTSGIISTIAGHGGFSSYGTGDGGPATAATFNFITGLATDDAGNVYVCDFNAGEIRKIDTHGIITTIAGHGVYAYAGENLPSLAAGFNPLRIAFDEAGNLSIADKYNRRVLKLHKNADIIYTIAGNGTDGFSGDGGPALAAQFNFPAGIAFDTCGSMYIADVANHRIRKVTYPHCHYMAVADEQMPQTGLSIYPNPANDELHIDNLQSNACFGIYNVIGQAVQQDTLQHGNNTITLQYIAKGVYTLVITDEQNRRTIHKIVKQ